MDDFERAVLIAFDHSQNVSDSIRKDAEKYCSNLKLSIDGWRFALPKLTDATLQQKNHYIIFWSLEVIFYTLSTHFPQLCEDDKNALRTGLMVYVRDTLPKVTLPRFLLGKISSIFVALISHDFPTPWQTFFSDFSSILPTITPTITNLAPVELYLLVLKSLEEDIIQHSAAFSILRDPQLSMRVKDALRDGPIIEIIATLHRFLVNFAETQHEIVIQTLNILSVLITWIELELVVDNRFFPFVYQLTSHSNIRIVTASLNLIKSICDKGMAADKRLALYQHLNIVDFLTSWTFPITVMKSPTALSYFSPQQSIYSTSTSTIHPRCTMFSNQIVNQYNIDQSMDQLNTLHITSTWLFSAHDENTNPQYHFQSETTDLSCTFAQLLNSVILRFVNIYQCSIENYSTLVNVKITKSKVNTKAIFNSPNKPPSNALPPQHDTSLNYYSFFNNQKPESRHQIFTSSSLLLLLLPTLFSLCDHVNFEVFFQLIESISELLSLFKLPGIFDELYLQTHGDQFLSTYPINTLKKCHFLYNLQYHLPYTLFGPGPLSTIAEDYQKVLCLSNIPKNAQEKMVSSLPKGATSPSQSISATLSLYSLGYRDSNNQEPLDPTFYPATSQSAQLPIIQQVLSSPILPSPHFTSKKQEILTIILYHIFNNFQYPSWYQFSEDDNREALFDVFRNQSLERIFKQCASIDLQFLLFFTHRHMFYALQLMNNLSSRVISANDGATISTLVQHPQQTTPQHSPLNLISDWLFSPIYQYIPLNLAPELIHNPNSILTNSPTVGTSVHVLDSNQLPATFNIRSLFPLPFHAAFPNPQITTPLHPAFILPLSRTLLTPPTLYTASHPINPAFIHQPPRPIATSHNSRLFPSVLSPLLVKFEALYKILSLLPDLAHHVVHISQLIPFGPLLATLLANPIFAFFPSIIDANSNQFLPSLHIPGYEQLQSTPLTELLHTNIDRFHAPQLHFSLVQPVSYLQFVSKYSQLLLAFPQITNQVLESLIVPTSTAATYLQRSITYITKHIPQNHALHGLWNFPLLLSRLSSIIHSIITRKIVINDTALLTSSVCADHSITQQQLPSNSPLASVYYRSASSPQLESNQVDILLAFCETVALLSNRTYTGPDQAVHCLVQCLEIPLQALKNLLTSQTSLVSSFGLEIGHELFALRIAECQQALYSMFKDSQLADFIDPRALSGQTSDQIANTQAMQLKVRLQNTILDILAASIQAYLATKHTLVLQKLVKLLHCSLGLLHDIILPYLYPIFALVLLSMDSVTLAPTFQLVGQFIRSSTVTNTPATAQALQSSPFVQTCQSTNNLHLLNGIQPENLKIDYNYAIMVKLWPIIQNLFDSMLNRYVSLDQRLLDFQQDKTLLKTTATTSQNTSSFDTPQQINEPSDEEKGHVAVQTELIKDKLNRDQIRKVYLWLLRDLCSYDLFSVFEYHAQFSPTLQFPQLTESNSNQAMCIAVEEINKELQLNSLIQTMTQNPTQFQDYRMYYFSSLSFTLDTIASTAKIMTRTEQLPPPSTPFSQEISTMKTAILTTKQLLQLAFRIDMNMFQYSENLHQTSTQVVYQVPKILAPTPPAQPTSSQPSSYSQHSQPSNNGALSLQYLPLPSGIAMLNSPTLSQEQSPALTQLFYTFFTVPPSQPLTVKQLSSPFFNNTLPSIQHPNLPSLHSILQHITRTILTIPLITSPQHLQSIVTPFNIKESQTLSIFREIVSFSILLSIISPHHLPFIFDTLLPIISPDPPGSLQQPLSSHPQPVQILLSFLFTLFNYQNPIDLSANPPSATTDKFDQLCNFYKTIVQSNTQLVLGFP